MLRKDLLLFIFLGIIFILIISVPYIWADQNAGEDHQFGGFLLNPIDGNSYLAKMYQGSLGEWKFTLPYTFEPGSGGYLFLFYIALGQFTRLVSGSLLTVFHAARIIGSGLLVISLWNFFHQTLPSKRSIWLALSLALFGSGMGWLAASFGLFTADFWVAEGFPFLSAYANPHFPLGIAILIWILTPNQKLAQRMRTIYRYLPEISWLLLALILALILPFGVVISGVVLGGYGLWKFLFGNSVQVGEGEAKNDISAVRQDPDSWWKMFFVLIGGLPVMVYQLWITYSNPELAAWNAQNLTASPAIWDLLISYSPTILLAIPGGYLVWKSKDSNTVLLLIWAVLGVLLLYIPWDLQRRFILGYMIPLAGLAAIGLDYIFERKKSLGLVITLLILLLIVPTNLMILLGGVQAVNSREPKVLLHREEMMALDWIIANTNQNALILASPQMGLYLPAYTGREVLYGHPFETINATEMQTTVEKFFSGQKDIEDLPAVEGESYVFIGPREQKLGRNGIEGEFELVYSSQQIRIYEVIGQENVSSVEDIQ
jgi:hypothetical protein